MPDYTPAVTNTIKRPDGTAAVDAVVSIELAGEDGKRIAGFVTASNYTVEGLYKPAVNSTTAVWSQALVPNSLISPANTVYKIVERVDGVATTYYVTVTNVAGPLFVEDILAEPPTAVPSNALVLHMADPVDAHDASAVSFNPAGTIAADSVQAAIVELDTDAVHKTSNETVGGVKTFTGHAHFGSGMPWIDVRALGAVGDGVTDDRAAFLAALNAAKNVTVAGRRVVFVPPTDAGYYLSSGIDLSANVYTGVTIMALGGWNDTQHGPPPSVNIRSGSGPVFYGANYSHMRFAGLSFYAPSGSHAFHGDYTFKLKFFECSATSTGAAPAWKFENSFWNDWDGGRSLCDAGQRTFDFITKNTTATSLEVIGGNMRWHAHVFQHGHVRLYQTATSGFAAFAGFSFDECNTEAFTAPQALVDVQQAGGGATNVIAENIAFDRCELADSTGNVAYINVGPTATVRWVDFGLSRGTNGSYWTVESGGILYGIGGSGGAGAHQIGADTPYCGASAVVNGSGFDIRGLFALAGAPTADQVGGGGGVRFFRDAEAYSRVTISDSGLQLGGGSGAFDTNLYRNAASVLKTDDKLVAALGIGVGNSAAATTPGTVTKKMEVFDASGASLGFVAIYDAIT